MGKSFRLLRDLGSIRLLKAVTGPLRTNAYLILGVETSEAVLVDSPPGVWEALQPILDKGVTLKWILLTHGHFDHAAEASLVRSKTGAEVFMHPADKILFRVSESVASDFGISWVDPEVTNYVSGDENLNLISSLRINALHTPGHTPGSLTYYLADFLIAFTGDTLFKGTIGATHFPGGSYKDMASSLRKIFDNLPLETVIYPGHGDESILRDELIRNRYIKEALLGEKE